MNWLINLLDPAYFQEMDATKIASLKSMIELIKLNDGNITFYYIDLGKYDEDKKQINELFFQSVCLIKFNDLYKKGEIILIWIPTETERNFNYSIINKENINGENINKQAGGYKKKLTCKHLKTHK